MKSRNKVFKAMLALCSVFSIGLITSCGNDGPGTFEGLSKKMEEKIKRDYYNFYIRNVGDYADRIKYEDITIEKYFGTFEGERVGVIITGSLASHIGKTSYKCVYFDGKSQLADASKLPRIWDKGKFYYFLDAYDEALVSFEDTLYIFENLIIYECHIDETICTTGCLW